MLLFVLFTILLQSKVCYDKNNLKVIKLGLHWLNDF